MKIIKKLALLLFIFNTLLMKGNEIVTLTKNQNTITANFTLPTYLLSDSNTIYTCEVDKLFKYIKIDNFGIVADLGRPILPQYTINVAVPNNSLNYSVSINNLVTSELYLNEKIYPYQEILETVPVAFNYDSIYYNSTGYECSPKVQLTDSFSTFDQKGTALTILPFTYNPVENKLTILHSATFAITYELSQDTITQIYSTSAPRERYLSRVFENFNNGISRVKSSTSIVNTGKYLIITPNQFESTLSSFVSFKQSIGYTVTVVNTNTTGSTSTTIKNYIQNLYNNTNTRPDFILLVGDVNDIPASGGISGSDSNPLTDLNYSLLSGSDYHADVFIGRWSVTSNQELQNIINKTIYMESNISTFSKNAALLSGGEDGANVFDNPQRWVDENTLTPDGWNCRTHYAIDGATMEDGLDELNNDNVLIIYRGHGYSNSMNIGPPFDFGNGDINNLTINRNPMFFSFACLTNNFGVANCFGESWIRNQHGGIAFYGATMATNRNVNNVLEEQIFGKTFIDEKQLGIMVNAGVKEYYNRFWSWLFRDRTIRHIKSYNLLGDPSFNRDGNCIQDVILNQDLIHITGSSLTYQASNSIKTFNTFVLESGSAVLMKSGGSIELNAGFNVEVGAAFEAKIAACGE